jgi:hypothetical protein
VERLLEQYKTAVIDRDTEEMVKYVIDVRFKNMKANELIKEYEAIAKDDEVYEFDVISVQQIDDSNMKATVKVRTKVAGEVGYDLPIAKRRGVWKIIVGTSDVNKTDEHKQKIIDKSQPLIISGGIEDKIPDEIRTQWEEAKSKLNETTILQHDGNWYIHPKKGYLVDRIEVNGREGIIILVKASTPKAEATFPTLAKGFDLDSLKLQ